jgi:hypothetical protein
MQKIVPLFKIFKTMFCFKFLELGENIFRSAKVWKILNVFQPFKFRKRFKPFDPRRYCCRGPTWQPPDHPCSSTWCIARSQPSAVGTLYVTETLIKVISK